MKTKQVIGWIMLIGVFVGFGIMMAPRVGLEGVLIVFGVTAGIVIWIGVGIYLIQEDDSKMTHRPDCAQLEVRDCPLDKSLHGEKTTEHWWSGWPGAYCLKCGDENKTEICIAGSCHCECHDEFWKSFEDESNNCPRG